MSDTVRWRADLRPFVGGGDDVRAAALLPSGQVLATGGYRVFCGTKNCDYEPSANAELSTP